MITLKLLSLQETGPRIEALAISAKAVQEEIHLIAVSCLAHARDHGDIRPMAQLLNALPNGQRVRGLVAWARNFSSKKLGIKQDDNKSWIVEIQSERVPEDFKVDEAMNTTFADFTTEKDPTSVTVESLIRNLTRTANNDEMHTDGITPKVSLEARAVAAKLLSKYREDQASKAA
jgi:hypothetical protein